jgi:hypothetical protein
METGSILFEVRSFIFKGLQGVVFQEALGLLSLYIGALRTTHSDSELCVEKDMKVQLVRWDMSCGLEFPRLKVRLTNTQGAVNSTYRDCFGLIGWFFGVIIPKVDYL